MPAGARNMSAAIVNKVANATTGAAASEVLSGISSNALNTSGITVTAINMITVPATVGVNIPPEKGKARREQELKKGRYDDEACHRGGAALDESGDAYRNESPGSAHDEHVAGSDPTDTDGLENRRGATDQQGGKDGPRDVTFGLPGNTGHNNNSQDHRRQQDQRSLNAGANGHQIGRTLVWFVSDVVVYLSCCQRSSLFFGFVRQLVPWRVYTYGIANSPVGGHALEFAATQQGALRRGPQA